MQRKCQGCNKTFTPPNYSMMRCRSCAKGEGYPKKLTEAEMKERDAALESTKCIKLPDEERRKYTLRKKKKANNIQCKCVICGKEYMGNSRRGKYCSDNCRNKGKEKNRREYNEKRRNERKCS